MHSTGKVEMNMFTDLHINLIAIKDDLGEKLEIFLAERLQFLKNE